MHFVIFLKGNNKLELDKKGFDNLANKEQGEQQKKDEEENQEKPKSLEETTSCEHQDQRQRLGKETQAKENQDKDGRITADYFIKTFALTFSLCRSVSVSGNSMSLCVFALAGICEHTQC